MRARQCFEGTDWVFVVLGRDYPVFFGVASDKDIETVRETVHSAGFEFCRERLDEIERIRPKDLAVIPARKVGLNVRQFEATYSADGSDAVEELFV